LWKDLGRSDQAWQAWVDSIGKPAWEEQQPVQSEFAATHRVLPNVVLKDLDGNAWPADRFLHKTTIAVVWATWCAPCVKELPFVAQLAERFKTRDDVQVVSFNVDESPGLPVEFVRKNGYKFPVLPAKDFAESLMPFLSIPRTWIIRDGAIVEEAEGFGNGDRWSERVVAQMK
jgi:thiol-disulfide isomerase/thioredoxin